MANKPELEAEDSETINNATISGSLQEPISVPVTSLAIGVITALVLTSTLNGFTYLNITIDKLSNITENNYAAVSASKKAEKNPLIQNQEPRETNKIIVKYKEGKKLPPGLEVAAERANLEKAQGLKHVLSINGIDAQVYEVSEDDSASEVVDRILATKKGIVEYAEVDMLVSPTFIPDDPSYGSQWHHPKIDSPTAWSSSTRGEGIIMATLDTGVDPNHPDLTFASDVGWNTYGNDSNWVDIHGHGTMVAGTSNATGDNALGVAGVAFNALVMPIRITDDSGYATYSSVASGIIYAADNGAKVANTSFANVCKSSSIASASNYLRGKGGVAVFAAGNTGTDEGILASDPHICVSATASNDVRTSWSSFGAHVDLSAPGAGIYTTRNGGGYSSVSGTSFSSPVTAGVYALVFSANPDLTPAEADSIIFTTADDLGEPGWDQYYGHGRVNAANAVALALATQGTQDTTPPTTPTGLVASNITDKSVTLSWSPSTDNLLVSGYNIYRDGQRLTTTSNTSYTDSSLSSNTQYSYTISAIDSSNNESPQSASTAITTQDVAFNITSYSVTSKTNSSATVGVVLTKSGTVTINYGTNSSNLDSSVQSTNLNTTHSLDLLNLTARTTYYYQVVTTDQTGTTVTSSTSNFKTPKGGGGKDGGGSGGNKGKKPTR